jgi:hypothetical protein
MAAGVMPPQPTVRWEILSETPDGDTLRFRVRYSNDSDLLELETTWQAFEGASGRSSGRRRQASSCARSG